MSKNSNRNEKAATKQLQSIALDQWYVHWGSPKNQGGIILVLPA